MAKIPSNASPINFAINDVDDAKSVPLGSTVQGGTPTPTSNITTLLENAINGLFKNSIQSDTKTILPMASELNGLFYSVFGLLAHIQQNGIQEYNANIEYPAFALAKSVDGEALYQSKVNLNKGNALTDTTKWLSLCNISDLQYLLQATNTTRGTARFATDAEALAGALNNVAVTPSNLQSTKWNPLYTGYLQNDVTITPKNTLVKLIFSRLGIDNLNAYNASNGRFTPNVAGWYYIHYQIFSRANGTNGQWSQVHIMQNGVGVDTVEGTTYSSPIAACVQSNIMLYFNGTTDYIETFASYGDSNGTALTILSNDIHSRLQIIRLRS